MKRRIEILAFERERIVRHVGAAGPHCPVCSLPSEWLTTAQAAALARVKPQSIYRWLAEGKAHGVRTPGGQHRVCRNSLFTAGHSN
jgi:excisionase family DNA binding protein